jgi:hypothetical protein
MSGTDVDWITVVANALTSGAGAGLVTWLVQRGIGHALEVSLQTRKQEFERELEEQRQAALAALERFKAQLTLDAELGRQVAAARIKALASILQITDELIDCCSRAESFGGGEESDAEATNAMDRGPEALAELSTAVQRSTHLFPQDAADRLARLVQVFPPAWWGACNVGDPRRFGPAAEEMQAAHRAIDEFARGQLGIAGHVDEARKLGEGAKEGTDR